MLSNCEIIYIPQHVYKREELRYYVIADVGEEMVMVMDRTLPRNEDQIKLLEDTKDKTCYQHD